MFVVLLFAAASALKADTVLQDANAWLANQTNLNDSFWMHQPFSECDAGVVLPVWTTPDVVVLSVTTKQSQDREFLKGEMEKRKELLHKCVPLATFNETQRLTLEKMQLHYKVARLEHQVQALVAESDNWKKMQAMWSRIGMDILKFLFVFGVIAFAFDWNSIFQKPKNVSCVI